MLATLLLSVAPIPAANAIAGFYRSNQMEIGAALELQQSGHFRYALDYGAVSEIAEGDWALDGSIVRLTTRPAAPDIERSPAAFRSEPLLRDGDDLLLNRYETVIRFERVRPGEQ
jgi:hypothetical protein